MEHRNLLLRNIHGAVIIYENTHHINSTRNYHTVQFKRPSQSIWIDLHGNQTRHVRITTSRHLCKQLTRTMFAQLCILPSQTHTRIMATCVETYLIHIGSEWFWNWLFLTRTRISSDDCTENVLWKYHNRLGGKIIMCYNNEMELQKKIYRHIND